MNMAKDSIFYITKDRERAEGIPESDNYFIVGGKNGEDTLDILSHAMIPKGSSILVFKNSKQIEELATKKGFKLLNPSAALAETIENKVTQVSWLGDLAKLLPPHKVGLVKNISRDTTGILQWAHSHTGGGTTHLEKELDLTSLQEKFPEREARVSKYIKGPMFTANVVVAKDKILVGNISYQITGIPPFTDNPFSTIGNDWSVPSTILTESHLQEFDRMAIAIGEKLQKEGWKGLFGVDIIYDEEGDKLFLIEINARQSASTTYESQLQVKARGLGVKGITTFEAHIAALTDRHITSPLVIINDGAQIIQRVTSKAVTVDTIKLEKAGYNVITYKNSKPNSDRFRIQSRRGIMETHNKFNSRGKEIEESVK